MVAPWRAATARSVSANATSGWNDADLGPGGHRGRQDLGAEDSARVDHRLAAVHPDPAPRPRRHGVVRHGDDDELDLLDQGGRLAEGAAALDEAPEPLSTRGSRLATAWIGQPARVRATPRAVPTAPAPMIPMIGGSPASAPGVGMWVLVLVDLRAVAMVARRQRIEVDPGSPRSP